MPELHDGSLAQVNGMVGTVALVTAAPVRIGQHLPTYRLATAVGIDAVDHHLKLVASVNGEHLRQLSARLVAMLEPHRPAGVVGSQLPVTCQCKFPPLALEHHDGAGCPCRWQPPARRASRPGARVVLRSPSTPLPKNYICKWRRMTENRLDLPNW
jgi:hypothetical protein